MKWYSEAFFLIAGIELLVISVIHPSGDDLIRLSVYPLFALGAAIYLKIEDKD